MSTITKSNVVALSKLDGPDAQKREILDVVGDLSQYELLDDECLVAIYVESNVLSEGKRHDGSPYQLVGTDNRATESRYQAKAHLLLKKGPTAFKWHNNGQGYEGVTPNEGDWVVLNASDGREIALRGMSSKGAAVLCKRIKWSSIFMRVKDPRVVH
jgi:hypothetical protein